MSYDLMVFSAEAAPKTRAEFMTWFDVQTNWSESAYDDPSVTTPELRAWLLDITKIFPDMNGPDASEDHESDYETDYSIGKSIIYIAFSWSLYTEANQAVIRLAAKHQVGLFDASGTSILFPHNGELKPMEELYGQPQEIKKPWWKW
ncbi:hypothetical protein JAO73_01530 [Hymenobacter sp. BT523]|uniref:hypothetical protein n=1 Tax=Hymenobacter sp. BT523 TaxID=2795725 RepID=UPI0018ED444F|nr:hypothetical protein [Hymenobacter sp. BT523]MBJ6107674.1 hypothetical protein [Hymenobacter sp. BT523]